MTCVNLDIRYEEQVMVIGKSHRMVIEVDPDFKKEIYKQLKSRGLTLKEWFTNQVEAELLNEQKPVKTTTKGPKGNDS